jgi:hypothetical protein
VVPVKRALQQVWFLGDFGPGHWGLRRTPEGPPELSVDLPGASGTPICLNLDVLDPYVESRPKSTETKILLVALPPNFCARARFRVTTDFDLDYGSSTTTTTIVVMTMTAATDVFIPLNTR